MLTIDHENKEGEKSFLAKIELLKSLISRGESESNVDRLISEWFESGENDWSSLSNILSIEEISKFSMYLETSIHYKKETPVRQEIFVSAKELESQFCK